MAKPNQLKMNQIKIALLGQGPFAKPSFDLISQEFQITSQGEADCLLVANYGKILTLNELNQPKYGSVNIHGSILPKYRGSSPIQTAIANGDKSTGITIIKMDEKVDHGPILATDSIDIGADDTTSTLRIKLGQIASHIIVSTLNDYFLGKIKPIVQDESKATLTRKIDFKNTELNPKTDPQTLYNQFRAYRDEPGAYIRLGNDQILKIIDANLIEGKFLPIQVQREGKKPVKYEDFLNGYHGVIPFK